MIKLERTDVMNMENAIRGARNPMNSWDRMDSGWEFVEDPSVINPNDEVKFILGPNDLALARKLIKAGSDHRKFMRQIFVSVDITAPFYWWKEMDTYKVATVANSCSTMHKLTHKKFEVDDFSHEHLDSFSMRQLECLIEYLNKCRDNYLGDYGKINGQKGMWWQMIQLLPSSYNQLRTVTLNYETLLNQYHARKHHKLDEWHTYCDWIETLPYFKEMCLDGDVNDN
jgi:hypothetical protein